MRHPVTLGSRVPEWPVLSTLRIFLIQATTSWEDGFDGLSKLITPYCFRMSMGRFVGEYPHGRGVKCDVLTFSLSKFLRQKTQINHRQRKPH